MPKPFKLPPMFFVASISASLFFAAGVIGLFVPDIAPLLADRPIAFSCLGAGAMLEIWAVIQLITSARQNAAQKNEYPSR